MKRKRRKSRPVDGAYWSAPRRSEEEELAQQLLGMGSTLADTTLAVHKKFKLDMLVAEGIVLRAVVAKARAHALTPTKPSPVPRDRRR